MIDVVFLLLIFFLLTANFRRREGFLPAELPRRVTRAAAAEIEPLPVMLDTRPDGACRVQIGSQPPFIIPATTTSGPSQRRRPGPGFDLLAVQLRRVLHQQQRYLDDPIKLMPSRRTRWDHVVKSYDALWRLNVHNIIFALAD